VFMILIGFDRNVSEMALDLFHISFQCFFFHFLLNTQCDALIPVLRFFFVVLDGMILNIMKEEDHKNLEERLLKMIKLNFMNRKREEVSDFEVVVSEWNIGDGWF
jgi:hypothetical protein